jgi:hypothetical protein
MEKPVLDNNNEEIEEVINRQRKRTIQKKIGAKKEYIEEKDLENLIENMKLTISQEELGIIFNRLDVEKTGKVNLESLMENIKKEEAHENNLTHIFKTLHENLTTKSEKIINKLKKLRIKAESSNDIESIEHLNW